MNYINLKSRAKINLTLDVTGVRDDGYHELKMIMQTVELYDRVYIKKIDKPYVKLKSNLEWLPADNRNLAFRAADIIRSMYGIESGVFIELNKSIPVAAGLAGGSSDCASVLYGMNILFGLKINRQDMAKIALKLGSDVPYCLMRGTALAEGRGEILTRLNPCPQAWIVLAKPMISLSTPAVYKALDSIDIDYHPDTEAVINAINAGDIRAVADGLSNVLEAASIPMCPMIGEIKAELIKNGALGALMSGSGPTVFGIFDSKKKAAVAANNIKAKFNLRDVILTKIFNA
ncbi:MAG: 4-(cytidine 5'-diphospho)-2-C-methyl-D-erythritol kinase [Clostridiales bacterium]|nr:4-(cytidine 5'-diphospho)-2-C-methyl-D-erythritol kinase [Clostridiales bacterium]